MICKDCLPVFYTPEELGAIPELERLDWPEFSSSLDNQHRLIFKHVELCPQHAAEEAETATPRAVINKVEAAAKERRRYLLLDLAARISIADSTLSVAQCVDRAEQSLFQLQGKRYCLKCTKPIKRKATLFCSKRCRGLAMRGSANRLWRGGKGFEAIGYRMQYRPGHERASGGYVREHILVAEKALGHPLPPFAVVHHHDENRANNAGANLVICPDDAYHKMLHARLRFIADGVDPDSEQRCTACKVIQPLSAFYPKRTRWNGRYSRCIHCENAVRRQRRIERREKTEAQQ